MPNLNERIKIRREQLDLTLEQVGLLVGVPKGTVQRWESGVIKNMRRDKLLALSCALQTTVGYLLGATDDPEQPEQLSPLETKALREVSKKELFQQLLHLAGFNESLDEDGNVTIYKDNLTVNETPELIEKVMWQTELYFIFLLKQEGGQ